MELVIPPLYQEPNFDVRDIIEQSLPKVPDIAINPAILASASQRAQQSAPQVAPQAAPQPAPQMAPQTVPQNVPVRQSAPVVRRNRAITRPQQQTAPTASQTAPAANPLQQSETMSGGGESPSFMPTKPTPLANESVNLGELLKDNWGILGLIGLLSALSRMDGRNTAGQVIGGAGLDSLNALGGIGNAIQAQKNRDQENQRKYENTMAQTLMTNQQHRENVEMKRQQLAQQMLHWQMMANLAQQRIDKSGSGGGGKKKAADTAGGGIDFGALCD